MYKIIGADQREYGPVDLDQVRSWILEGRANGQTMVQGEGHEAWKPLSTFPELAALIPPPTPFTPTTAGSELGPPGAYALPAGQRPEINTYLYPAIFSTLCCCIPLGVVSIVYAARAQSKMSVADFAAAEESARKARFWFYASLIGGILYAVAMVLFALYGGGAKNLDAF